MSGKCAQIWRKRLRFDPVPSLLAAGNQAIACFTRRELLGEKVEPIDFIWGLPEPQKILKKQQADGSWKGKEKGDVFPRNHYTLVETYKQFRELIEKYAFTKARPAITKAAEFLFSFKTKEGDIRGFIGNQYATYYTGCILSLLIRAGYKDDPRAAGGLDWLLSMRQNDGGWTVPIQTHKLDRKSWIRLTSKYAEPLQPDRTRPFSHNATDMVLRAFAVHPVYRKRGEVVAAGRLLKSSFFQPDNYSSYHDPRYWTRFAYQWPNLLTAMESLQFLRFPASDPDIKRALDWFIANQQSDALWKLEQEKGIKPKEKEIRLWLSLRVCRMLKKYYG